MDPLPDPGIAPGVEVVGDRLPGGKVMRQHPPGAAATGHGHEGVDDLAEGVCPGPTGRAIPSGEEVLNVLPLEIGQVAGITRADGRGVHNERSTARMMPKTRFLDGL